MSETRWHASVHTPEPGGYELVRYVTGRCRGCSTVETYKLVRDVDRGSDTLESNGWRFLMTGTAVFWHCLACTRKKAPDLLPEWMLSQDPPVDLRCR